jgi:glutathione S-transferase
MELLYQTHSPYARKVLVAAHEMGLQQRLCVVHHETSPTRRNEAVLALNPLGKVPVLICDDATVLFDSNVICEYLDGLHPNARLIPREPAARWRALKMQALAQGIADAGIAARWEASRRPAQLRWPTMQAAQVEKIAQACDFLEREIEQRAGERAAGHVGAAEDVGATGDRGAVGRGGRSVAAGEPGRHGASVGPSSPDIGDIALVTALSWLEFRAVYAFLPGRPRLAAWYEALCSRPSMLATALTGETQD